MAASESLNFSDRFPAAKLKSGPSCLDPEETLDIQCL